MQSEKRFVSGHRFSDANQGSGDKRLQPLGRTAAKSCEAAKENN
jgi:hypothetical protein